MAAGLHDHGIMGTESLDARQGICTAQVRQGDEFVDAGDWACTALTEKNTGAVKWIILDDDAKGVVDRIIFDRDIFDVKALQGTNAMRVERDDTESGLIKFQDMGVSIEKGIRVPVNQSLSPEDEHFVNQWVGIWTRNIAENYALIRKSRSIKGIKDLCATFPAVIVGAGPSLDKNIQELQDINAIIIAVDRAYKPLLAHGIEPDLVVSVDCHDEHILRYLDKVDSAKHTLVLNSAADYKIAREWKGRVLYFNMGHAGIQFCDRVLPFLFPDFMAVANVGCVANTALIAANWIGCRPLILAGCDFSYPGRKMSCETYDVVDGKLQKIEVNEEERFEKRSGKIQKNGIYTYPPYLDYTKTMEVLEKSQNFNIINATEGGIIDAFPRMTLREAKSRHCINDVTMARNQLKEDK